MTGKNVFQRLAKVREKVPYLQKGKQGNQYSYVGSSDVLGALHGAINENGLLLIPSIVEHSIRENIDVTYQYNKYTKQQEPKNRITYFTEIKMIMRWQNIDDKEDYIECPWYAQGVDIAGEKGVGKALTYGEKYFLLKFFNIATDSDDPDYFQEKNESKLPPAPIDEVKQKVARGKVEEFAQLQGGEPLGVYRQVANYLKINSDLQNISDDEFGILMNYLNEKLNTGKTTQQPRHNNNQQRAWD